MLKNIAHCTLRFRKMYGGNLNCVVIKHKSYLSPGYMSKYHSLYLTHVCTDLKRLRPERYQIVVISCIYIYVKQGRRNSR